MATVAVRGSRKTQVKDPKPKSGPQFNPPALVDKTCRLCGETFSIWEQEGRPERTVCYGCDPVPSNAENEVDSAKSKIETPKSAAASESIELTVSIDAIEAAPQVREDFGDEAELAALAESIRQQGLLQRPIVRPIHGNLGKPRWRLVAGERRWRAAKLAGLKEIPVKVIDADDAESLLIQGEENLQRKDLNDVEKARWCQRMTSPARDGGGGLTQEQLAQRLGVTQAEISNRIRLLKAPAWALALVISGQMTRKHAEQLLPFASFDSLNKAIEKDARQVLKRGGEFGSAEDFRELAHDTVRRLTAPIEDDDYRYELGGRIKYAIAEADLETLETVLVRTYEGDRPRAIDKKRAEKLLAAARAEALAQAEAKAKKKGKGKRAAADKKLSPAEQKRRDEQLAEQHKNRVEAWFYDWLRVLCAAKIKGADWTSPAAWLATWALVEQPVDDQEVFDLFFQPLATAGAKAGRAHARSESLLLAASLNDGQLRVCQESLAVGLLIDEAGAPRTPGWDGSPMQNEVVASLANLLKLDVAAAWRDDRRSTMRQKFWELHSKEQLLELGGELKVPLLETQKKSVMVNLLLGQEKPLPLPKSLAGLVAKASGKKAEKRTRSRGGAE